MFKFLDVFGGRHGAFLKTVVRYLVHDDEIVLTNEPFDDAETSHPPRWVNQDICVPILPEFFGKLKVKSG